MKRGFGLVAAFLLAVLCFASEAIAQVRVRGHSRKSGGYVQPHYRSRPDGNFFNNWSTKGNINPYTGAIATRVTPPNRGIARRANFNAGLAGSAVGGQGLSGSNAANAFGTRAGLDDPSSLSEYENRYSNRGASWDSDDEEFKLKMERVRWFRERDEAAKESSRKYVASLQRTWSRDDYAAARLRLAKQHLNEGRTRVAERWLQRVVDDYGETAAAEESLGVLATMEP